MIRIGNKLGIFIIKQGICFFKGNTMFFRLAEAFVLSHSNFSKVICTLYILSFYRTNKSDNTKHGFVYDQPKQKTPDISDWGFVFWWPRAESNHRHKDFQSSALPTELLGQLNHELYNSLENLCSVIYS